jgi:hypothetical protein
MMAKLLNENKSGFEINLIGFEGEYKDCNWICYTLGIMVKGEMIFKSGAMERRTMETGEIEELIGSFCNKYSFQFEPMEPDFYIKWEDSLLFALDVDRDFKGIRSYTGQYLKIEIDVGKEKMEQFSKELDEEYKEIVKKRM